jgi:dimethylhistidine N-methyltransferase
MYKAQPVKHATARGAETHRIRLLNQGVVDEALAGLSLARKTLPPKLFYDEAGCGLFHRITQLPEYYLTRTERCLLEAIAPAVARGAGPGAVLVEYGASDEGKAEILLRERDSAGERIFAAYMPIDVAAEGLKQIQIRMAHSYPDVAVHALAADFLEPLALPPHFDGATRLGFFPGSTIGNLDPAGAERFLRQVRDTLGQGAGLLIGADLRKDPSILIPAYDDAAGVTAAFNRNLLIRLNREAGADFDPMAFRHQAIWNDAESRIEMHLVSRFDQSVSIAGKRIDFTKGETIHTENSYKHVEADFLTLSRRAGWMPVEVWKDQAALFSIHLLRAG